MRDPLAWYRGDPEAMGAENHADWLRAVTDPAVIRAMVAEYRAGVHVDRYHEASDRAAGRRVTCPTLFAWSVHDDMEELYGDPAGDLARLGRRAAAGRADRLRPPHGRGGAGAARGRADGVPVRVEFLKALAHPLRLRVVDRLGHRGPAPVSQLAAELDATLPELSNGLRQLRDAGIVVASRDGPAASSTRSPTTGSRRCWTSSSRPRRGRRRAARRAPVAHVLRPPRRPARRRALPRAGRPRRASARRRRHGLARRSRAAARARGGRGRARPAAARVRVPRRDRARAAPGGRARGCARRGAARPRLGASAAAAARSTSTAGREPTGCEPRSASPCRNVAA